MGWKFCTKTWPCKLFSRDPYGKTIVTLHPAIIVIEFELILGIRIQGLVSRPSPGREFSSGCLLGYHARLSGSMDYSPTHIVEKRPKGNEWQMLAIVEVDTVEMPRAQRLIQNALESIQTARVMCKPPREVISESVVYPEMFIGT